MIGGLPGSSEAVWIIGGCLDHPRLSGPSEAARRRRSRRHRTTARDPKSISIRCRTETSLVSFLARDVPLPPGFKRVKFLTLIAELVSAARTRLRVAIKRTIKRASPGPGPVAVQGVINAKVNKPMIRVKYNDGASNGTICISARR
ncbi:hypothetical protein PUN28_016700 [Cardiocondyla obscurior]|uniref:Ribosomal protein S12 n=1 Tax=Cardiocondyla obscurior TaxID=286306 RepID=A0AAW2ES57_9HYME